MRVTTTATYRNYNRSLNSVHSKLNKSMNKISSGKEYENAAENPLAYYQGKKMDNQYQDIETKLELLPDVKNRIYQQELGARSIQSTLSAAKVKVEYILNDTNNEEMTTVDTISSDLIQKATTMANDLNIQYQDFYVFGGNDISTSPFSLTFDTPEDGNAEMVLTYNHVFPGEEGTTTSIEMRMNDDDADGTYQFTFSMTKTTVTRGADGKEITDIQTETDENEILKTIADAMAEQGRIDIGYGTIQDKSTLLDTYTGGLNVLTGLSSDKVKAAIDAGDTSIYTTIKERLNDSAVGLIGQSVCALEKYKVAHGENQEAGAKDAFHDTLSELMDKMTETEHWVTTVYSDLGNKYAVLETTETRLNALSDALEEDYANKLGADPYEAITEMYAYQYSYSASLQLGSQLMQSSLFDFIS